MKTKAKLLQVTMDLEGGRVWWLIPTSYVDPDKLWQVLETVGKDGPQRRGNAIWASLDDLRRVEEASEKEEASEREEETEKNKETPNEQEGS